jgi:hypothetical protein
LLIWAHGGIGALWGVSLGGVAVFGYISQGGERWRVQCGGCVRLFSEVGIRPRPVVGLGYVAGVASSCLAISPGVERVKGGRGFVRCVLLRFGSVGVLGVLFESGSGGSN